MTSACTPCMVAITIGSTEWTRAPEPTQAEALCESVAGLGGRVRDDGDVVTVFGHGDSVVGEAWSDERGWEWRVGPATGREFHNFANEVTNVLRSSKA